MVIVARLQWVLSRLAAGDDVRLSTTYHDIKRATKIKVWARPRTTGGTGVSNIQARFVQSLIDDVGGYRAADSGHKHSSGTSEITIWFYDLPATVHVGVDELSGLDDSGSRGDRDLDLDPSSCSGAPGGGPVGDGGSGDGGGGVAAASCESENGDENVNEKHDLNSGDDIAGGAQSVVVQNSSEQGAAVAGERFDEDNIDNNDDYGKHGKDSGGDCEAVPDADGVEASLFLTKVEASALIARFLDHMVCVAVERRRDMTDDAMKFQNIANGLRSLRSSIPCLGMERVELMTKIGTVLGSSG